MIIVGFRPFDIFHSSRLTEQIEQEKITKNRDT